jgi:cysteine synthase A
VRNLFTAGGLVYRSVDLDGPDYRDNDRGGDVRRALARRIGAVTIPQVFVGGRHIGGATETFDAFKDGSLQALLKALGREIRTDSVGDPYGFLPSWLHPRGVAASPDRKTAA